MGTGTGSPCSAQFNLSASPSPCAVYSMVKYAGVRNYVVGTWEAADLEACADLNLPCADVSSYLPENMTEAGNTGALGFGSHDYLVSEGLLAIWAEMGPGILSRVRTRA